MALARKAALIALLALLALSFIPGVYAQENPPAENPPAENPPAEDPAAVKCKTDYAAWQATFVALSTENCYDKTKPLDEVAHSVNCGKDLCKQQCVYFNFNIAF